MVSFQNVINEQALIFALFFPSQITKLWHAFASCGMSRTRLLARALCPLGLVAATPDWAAPVQSLSSMAAHPAQTWGDPHGGMVWGLAAEALGTQLAQ